jgi:hypothetical protein
MKTRPFALVLALCCGTSAAHNEIPAVTWCAQGIPVAVGTFELFPDTAPPPPEICGVDGSNDRDCGQFDDDYDRGRELAMQACGVHAIAVRGAGDFGSVVFIADAPASYLSPEHHALFQIGHGLSGTCVRCDRPPPAQPPVVPPVLPPRR